MSITLVKDFAAASTVAFEGAPQVGDLLVALIEHDDRPPPSGWTHAGSMNGKRIIYKTHTDPAELPPEYDVAVFRNIHKRQTHDDELLLQVLKPWNDELRRNHPEVPGFKRDAK